MADSLVYKLQDIKEDRNTNLKPENLKAGVTCLGIKGTLEPNTGSGVDPLYATTDYTTPTYTLNLNEVAEEIQLYDNYVIIHTSENKFKLFSKSDTTTPLNTYDIDSRVFILGIWDNKLYLYLSSGGNAYHTIDLTTYELQQHNIENTLSTSGANLVVNYPYDIVSYLNGSRLYVYKFEPDVGFTKLNGDDYNAGGHICIGKDMYVYGGKLQSRLWVINSDGSKSQYTVTDTYNNLYLSGINYLKTKAFVFSTDESAGYHLYVYSLNDNLSIQSRLSEIDIDLGFSKGKQPIFQCLNSKYYYIYIDNNNRHILEFNEETNQFTIVLTNNNLTLLNGTVYIDGTSQVLDFEEGNTEIGIMYNNEQYLTRGNYVGYTNNTLLTGHTMYDIAHEIVSGTMANNGDVEINATTSEQIKDQGYYNSLKVSAVTSDIDENIKAENIKSGVEILGVTGTLEEGIDTSDANATADDIVSPKTAYVNGEKITGALIKTNLQLSDLQEQGIDTSGAISGNNFVTCDNDNTSICIYTPMDLCIGKNSYFPATMSNDYIIKAIGLSADKIVQGNTILGIVGTGGAGTEYEPLSRLSTAVTDVQLLEESNFVTLSGVVSDTGIVTEDETTFVAGTSFANLANTIGLTADKIKKGETILGITGTYEGIVSQEEYEQAVDTTEQILGITDNQ